MMQKKQIKEMLPLTTEQLDSLRYEKTEDGLTFVEKILERHANGFYTDRIIFKKEDAFYQFLAVGYLDDQVTYTVPYRVFQEKVDYTRTVYGNWVDGEEAWC